MMELMRKCTECIRVEVEVDWIRTGDRKRMQMERKRRGGGEAAGSKEEDKMVERLPVVEDNLWRM